MLLERDFLGRRDLSVVLDMLWSGRRGVDEGEAVAGEIAKLRWLTAIVHDLNSDPLSTYV